MTDDDAIRHAYQALQRGDFTTARDTSEPALPAPAAALLHALACAGCGDIDAAAAALGQIAHANPAAQHPALDLADLLRRHGHDPLPHLEAALRHTPGHIPLLAAHAAVLLEAGSDAAIAAFVRVTEAAPTNPGAWSNLGKAFAAHNRFPEADAAFARAIALGAPPQIHLNRAVATLKSGDLAAGWPLFHARHTLPGRPPPPPGPMLRTLADAAGRTVLLLHNEGYGDTIQFIRYAPLLQEAGARVVALVPPPLVRLLRTNGIDARTTVDAYEMWSHIPDLPGVFGTTSDTVPATLPYLRADPALVAEWSTQLPQAAEPLRVGLVWAGETRLHDPSAAATDRLRSIPELALGPLLAAPVDWISLQHGTRPPLGVFDIMPGVTDFADTAAIIANLDLVVSVDTAVAHLAAALGTPVLLLDRHDNCWRWLSARDDSPWYPGLVHIIRQPRPGDWPTVLRQAAALLTSPPDLPSPLPGREGPGVGRRLLRKPHLRPTRQ